MIGRGEFKSSIGILPVAVISLCNKRFEVRIWINNYVHFIETNDAAIYLRSNNSLKSVEPDG